jgi:hypothetical protein
VHPQIGEHQQLPQLQVRASEECSFAKTGSVAAVNNLYRPMRMSTTSLNLVGAIPTEAILAEIQQLLLVGIKIQDLLWFIGRNLHRVLAIGAQVVGLFRDQAPFLQFANSLIDILRSSE